jgi:arylsulfatase A-like enzyme
LIFHFYGLEVIADSMGYDSHNYRGHVTCIDEQIKEISESLWHWEEEYSTFLVISDHGGKGYHHEHFNVESIQVPIAMWGYGIREKVNLFTKSVDTTQVAPTILSCLDYDVPEEWNHPVLKQVKMPDSDDLVSYSYYDYQNETHSMTSLYDSNEYCIVPFTSKHHHIDNIKIIFVILFVISFLVIFLFLYLLDNQNIHLDW